MRRILFLSVSAVFIINLHVFPQSDTINKTDPQGRKQGYWEKFYPNGKLMYKGYFSDGKPIGEMRRYYDTGELKVIMKYRQNSQVVNTRFFYDDGKIAGEGNYIGNQKDSLWKYYSYYTGTVTMTENYSKGFKDGVERKYYPGGSVSEEIEWKRNIKHGFWNQYFEDGTVKQKSAYVNNKVSGPYLFYWPNGQLYISGTYADNKRHGIWKFYSDEGKLKLEMVYHYGKAEDEEKLMEQDKEFFRMVEENMRKYQDFEMDDLMPGGFF